MTNLGFSERRKIPVTLPPLWETRGPMLTKIDVMKKFCNPLGIEKWTFEILVPSEKCQEACNITTR